MLAVSAGDGGSLRGMEGRRGIRVGIESQWVLGSV